MTYDYDAESYLDFSDSGDSESYLDSYLDYSGDFETYDAESRRRRRRPGPVKPASGGSAFRGRPGAGGPVTQAQLEAALARVREQVTANANAIKTVDGRVRTVISDAQRLQAMTKRDVDKLRSDLRTTQTLSALIPLVTSANPTSPFARAAPLLHLAGSDLLSGGQPSSVATGSSSSLLGSNTNLITIGALLYASGVFDRPAQ